MLGLRSICLKSTKKEIIVRSNVLPQLYGLYHTNYLQFYEATLTQDLIHKQALMIFDYRLDIWNTIQKVSTKKL